MPDVGKERRRLQVGTDLIGDEPVLGPIFRPDEASGTADNMGVDLGYYLARGDAPQLIECRFLVRGDEQFRGADRHRNEAVRFLKIEELDRPVRRK